jgi:hypothetical protein
MNDYVYYLTLYLNEFNHKSLLAGEAKKKTASNKIFRKPFDYLPNDYIEFLNVFKEYPDYFIEIPDYHNFKLQFLKNILFFNKYYRFELVYRYVWNKLERVRISIIGYTPSLSKPEFSYIVIRNFKFEQEIDEEYRLEFPDAFQTFFEYI